MKTSIFITLCIMCTFGSSIFYTLDYFILDSEVLTQMIASIVLLLISLIAFVWHVVSQIDKGKKYGQY